jgi:hypothetical protein
VPAVNTEYEKVCAAMVEAIDPDLRLTGGELVEMATSIARRISTDMGDARKTVLKMNYLSAAMYARAGEPNGPSDEARWRWFFALVDH